MSKKNQRNGIVYTFGKFSILHKGHLKLINTVIDAARELSYDYKIVVSQSSHDTFRWNFKKDVIKSSIPEIKLCNDDSVTCPFSALEKYAELGYKNIVLVVGEDRVEEFTRKLSFYAKKWGIDNFTVISAGDRNLESTDVDGLSSSKMRQYAISGNVEEFYNGLPDTLSDDLKDLLYSKAKSFDK
jgi:FAD synthase